MAARLPDGAVVSIGTSLGALKLITGITNADPGVASSTSHGYANGALLAITSGWSNLNNRVVRVASTATGTFALDSIDTTSTQLFPAGSGAGSVKEITAFTQISQIMGFTTSGGDQQYATYSFLEQNFETQIPTIFSAQTLTLDLADDPTLLGYKALKAASDDRGSRALKITMPDGSMILYYGYVSLNETPSVSKGQVMQVKASFSMQSRPVRYSA